MVQLWDWKDGSITLRQRLDLKTPNPTVETDLRATHLAPDGRLLTLLLVNGRTEQLQFWDVKQTPARLVKSIAKVDFLGPDEQGDFDRTLYPVHGVIFPAEAGQVVTIIEEKQRLNSSHQKLLLRWWDMRGEKPVERKLQLEQPPEQCDEFAFSPDGQLMLGKSDRNGDLTLWNLSSGKKLKSWKVPGSYGMEFAPDSRHLFTYHDNGLVYIWRLLEPKSRTP